MSEVLNVLYPDGSGDYSSVAIDDHGVVGHHPLTRNWENKTFPNITDQEMADVISRWSKLSKPRERIWRYAQKIYFTKGPTLYRMRHPGSAFSKQCAIAHIDGHRGWGHEQRLYILGYYARWMYHKLPQAWPVLSKRIQRAARVPLPVPCYHISATARPVGNAFHQRNADAFDRLLAHLARRMEGSRKHKSFFLNAQRKIHEEAQLYEQLTGAHLGIVTRQSFVLQSWRDKVA